MTRLLDRRFICRFRPTNPLPPPRPDIPAARAQAVRDDAPAGSRNDADGSRR